MDGWMDLLTEIYILLYYETRFYDKTRCSYFSVAVVSPAPFSFFETVFEWMEKAHARRSKDPKEMPKIHVTRKFLFKI
jgi:hypothetical protein